MAMNFDTLPQDKPNQSNVTNGRYTAKVFKTDMRTSKDSNNEYLNVSFKTNDGFVNENYFDSDKPFLQYKLGRLLKACKVTLKGEGTLRDVAKVIQGKDVVIDVAVNDRGYGSLDYSGNNEGIYAPDELAIETEAPELDADLNETIESDIALADEDF